MMQNGSNGNPGMNPWDERYSKPGYFYGTEPNDFLREHCALIAEGGNVLCLGEGEGRNAVFLAERGYRVVALDQSTVGLDKATRLAGARRVEIKTIATDLDGYQLEPARWDGIVSIWCHMSWNVRAAVYGRILSGLKPNGTFLLEAYTPEQLRMGTGGPKSADLLPTLAELRNHLNGLDLVHAVERERMVHEGTAHNGMSAVVQVIARRTS